MSWSEKVLFYFEGLRMKKCAKNYGSIFVSVALRRSTLNLALARCMGLILLQSFLRDNQKIFKGIDY
jgi:hypothetical protein